jgi:hypothetical protein
MRTLESPVGNEYLNSTLFPVVPSNYDLPASLVNEYRNSLSTNSSRTDISESSSRRSSLSLKRTSSAGNNVTSPSKKSFRQSVLTPPAAPKKRSVLGAASSEGRLFKVLADLFLLAGRTQDAVMW